MHRGYLALWRKSQDHPFFKERRIYSKWEAWLDMLLEARHKKEPKDVIIGMQVVTCKYGESIYSLQTWGIRWGWSPTKVKRFFDLLTRMNQIRYESVIVTTRVSILNYNKYDPKCNGFVMEMLCDRKATDFESLTNKNDKNDKNIILPNGNTSKPEVSTIDCPHEKIRELYNKILPELPQCTIRNKTFDKQTKSRWSEDKKRQNLDWWESLFKSIKESDFLMGRTKTPFQASLDWIVKPTNFTKILNGNYKNKHDQHNNFKDKKYESTPDEEISWMRN